MTVSQRAAFSSMVEDWLWLCDDVEVHHGDCVGVDADANLVAIEAGCRVVIHPPVELKHRAFCGDEARRAGVRCLTLEPLPYLVRNHAIVDATDLLVAFPAGPEQLRSGTWSTVRYARKQGKDVLIHGC